MPSTVTIINELVKVLLKYQELDGLQFRDPNGLASERLFTEYDARIIKQSVETHLGVIDTHKLGFQINLKKSSRAQPPYFYCMTIFSHGHSEAILSAIKKQQTTVEMQSPILLTGSSYNHSSSSTSSSSSSSTSQLTTSNGFFQRRNLSSPDDKPVSLFLQKEMLENTAVMLISYDEALDGLVREGDSCLASKS